MLPPAKGEGGEREVKREIEYPKHLSGLLAGLWEFPCVEVESDWSEEQMWHKLNNHLQFSAIQNHRHLGAVTHVFTHTHHHYHTWHVTVGERDGGRRDGEGRWVGEKELMDSSISTGVKKVRWLWVMGISH